MDRGGGGGPSRRKSSLPESLHDHILPRQVLPGTSTLTDEPQSFTETEEQQRARIPRAAHSFPSVWTPPPPLPSTLLSPATFEEGSSTGAGTLRWLSATTHLVSPPRFEGVQVTPRPPDVSPSSDQRFFPAIPPSFSRGHSLSSATALPHLSPPVRAFESVPHLPPVNQLLRHLSDNHRLRSWSPGDFRNVTLPPIPNLSLQGREVTGPRRLYERRARPSRVHSAPYHRNLPDVQRSNEPAHVEDLSHWERRDIEAHHRVSVAGPGPTREVRSASTPTGGLSPRPPFGTASEHDRAQSTPRAAFASQPRESSARSEERERTVRRDDVQRSLDPTSQGGPSEKEPGNRLSKARQPLGVEAGKARQRKATEALDDDDDETEESIRTAKKTQLACEFCRRRKLKCTGLKPTCRSCQKRGLPCEYPVEMKRRGPGKAPKRQRTRMQEPKSAQQSSGCASATSTEQGEAPTQRADISGQQTPQRQGRRTNSQVSATTPASTSNDADHSTELHEFIHDDQAPPPPPPQPPPRREAP
ncbi:hypothetical protein PHLCEN_2v13627 [Hermanssonia centrifuga]|uniref:Zn(2)-C6 fungal-type domain-containing protein n=1 Tax=Hermanssonia centrifuga TaxID=98765 RepID=A0A2R6NDT1_9APHY|nr:hypothetical protein PHLCEN_2v13627 [Hermanssonia centrifuga]